jgi:hypothetical protein
LYGINRCSKPAYSNQYHYINLHDVSAYDFLQAHVHELETEVVPDNDINDVPPGDQPDPEPPDTLLVDTVKGSQSTYLPPGEIRRVLSKSYNMLPILLILSTRFLITRSPLASLYHA